LAIRVFGCFVSIFPIRQNNILFSHHFTVFLIYPNKKAQISPGLFFFKGIYKRVDHLSITKVTARKDPILRFSVKREKKYFWLIA